MTDINQFYFPELGNAGQGRHGTCYDQNNLASLIMNLFLFVFYIETWPYGPMVTVLHHGICHYNMLTTPSEL